MCKLYYFTDRPQPYYVESNLLNTVFTFHMSPYREPRRGRTRRDRERGGRRTASRRERGRAALHQRTPRTSRRSEYVAENFDAYFRFTFIQFVSLSKILHLPPDDGERDPGYDLDEHEVGVARGGGGVSPGRDSRLRIHHQHFLL